MRNVAVGHAPPRHLAAVEIGDESIVVIDYEFHGGCGVHSGDDKLPADVDGDVAALHIGQDRGIVVVAEAKPGYSLLPLGIVELERPPRFGGRARRSPAAKETPRLARCDEFPSAGVGNKGKSVPFGTNERQENQANHRPASLRPHHKPSSVNPIPSLRNNATIIARTTPDRRKIPRPRGD